MLHNIFITYDECDCLEVPAFARNIVTDYVDALCSGVSTAVNEADADRKCRSHLVHSML